jgi:DNA-binding CsgD family transcriptional regulator
MRLIPVGLAAALTVQAFALVFFFLDAGEELDRDPLGLHPISEALMALGLALGMVLVARSLLASLRRGRDQASALTRAATEFRLLVETQFDQWQLTKAEREVALLSLQGHEMDRIAALRGAAVGTVRAQLTRIYAKSGTANRAQLSAVFVQTLLAPQGPRSETALQEVVSKS